MILADDVKTAVTVPMLLEFYGITISRGRCRCPIHNGSDRNMMIRDQYYHCWVCGSVGTVIDLQAAIAGETWKEALRSLNTIFNLGLDAIEPEKREAAKRRIEQRRLESLEKEAQKRWNVAQMDVIAGVRREMWKAAKNCEEIDKLLDMCEHITQENEVRLPAWDKMLFGGENEQV